MMPFNVSQHISCTALITVQYKYCLMWKGGE